MKISAKITLWLLASTLIPLLILGPIAIIAMNKISTAANMQSRDTTIQIGKAGLQQTAKDNALLFEHLFQGYQGDVIALRNYYDSISTTPAGPYSASAEEIYPDKKSCGLPGYGYVHPRYGAYANWDRRGYDGSLWMRKEITQRACSDAGFRSQINTLMNRLSAIAPFLSALFQKNSPALDLVWIVTTLGVAHTYPNDYPARLAINPAFNELNESNEPYVQLLDSKNNPGRKIVWLPPYFDAIKKIWMTSCIAPVYDGEMFVGSMGLDIMLSTLTESIMNMDFGLQGYGFIIDRSGIPLALPEKGIKDFALDPVQQQALNKIFRPGSRSILSAEELSAMKSPLGNTPVEGLREILSSMMRQNTGAAIIRLSGVDKIIAYASVALTGWSLGIVMPVDEIVKPSTLANSKIAEGTRTVIFFFLCAVVFVALITCAIGLYIGCIATRHMRSIIRDTDLISQGQTGHVISIDTRDELKTLADSVNRMVGVIKQREAALHISEEKYGELVECANSIILRWLPTGEITFLNTFGRHFFDYTKEKIIGKSIIGTIVPKQESSGRDLAAFMKQLAGQPDLYINNENENICKDGRRVWIAWTNRGVRDASNNIIEILSIGNDITDRKTTDEISRESEQRLAAIIEFLPDATLVIDRQGEIIAWNRSIEDMTGFTAAEMLGKGNYEYAIPFYGERRPILIDLVNTPSEVLAEKYTSVQKKMGILRGDADCPMARKESRFLSGWATPIYNLSGDIVGAIESIRDMTEKKQAEDSLRASESFISSIFNADPAGVSLAVNNVFIRVNRSFCNISGYAEEALVGQDTGIIYADDKECRRVRAIVYESIKTTDVVALECRGRRKDGAVIDVLMHVAPLNRENIEEGIIAAIIDITERKRIEEELLREKLFSDTLIQASPAFIVAISGDGRVLLMNDAMLSALGYTRDEVIGKNYLAAFITSDERQHMERLFDKLITDHIPTVNENKILAKDGSNILVEWHGQSFMKSNRLDFFIGVGIDITGRKQTENELRRAYIELQDVNTSLQESEQTLKMAINIAKTAVWEFDLQNRMVLIKKFPQELELDFPLSELPQNIDEYQRLYRPDSWEKTRSALNAYLRGDINCFEVEACMKGKNRNWIWVFITGKITHYGPDGTPQKMLCMSVDITKIKQAEDEIHATQEQLIQADKMIALGTLVAGVAHEINNPNNFVMLNTPLIQEVWKGIVPVLEEYCREYGDFKAGGMPYSKLRDGIPTLLGGILDGSRRISTIVKELKDFARPDEVSMEQRVDINAAVKASLSLLHNMIAKSTHAFTITYGDNLPSIPGNTQRLEQVFINLVQNACQALPDPSRGIYVATAFDGRAVSIIIRDEGCGIPQHHLGQLMDPFFTTKRSAGGTGLGLAISNKITTDHGGRIDVQSRVAEGSTFTVLLPLNPVKEKKKILIADDDEKQREIMYLTLSRNLAYEIRMVENGTDACILLGKWRPDLILLDVNMPGMNGVEVCRRIKSDPDFSDIKVIIVTGDPDRQSMKDIQEMGFTDLCEKPFSTDHLQNMAAAALGKKSDNRDL